MYSISFNLKTSRPDQTDRVAAPNLATELEATLMSCTIHCDVTVTHKILQSAAVGVLYDRNSEL